MGRVSRLTAHVGQRSPHRTPVRRVNGERRQLTVMFCDLVGSTQLSQQLDPEDLREVVAAYQEVCGAIIQDVDGHIAQYLGDGILVYFGYPTAHEDDPTRAVDAALEILAEIPKLDRQLGSEFPILHSHPLQVRIGVHTGRVVVGEMGGGAKREELALGETVNITARLLGVSEPGWVVVSDDTGRLLKEHFVLETLGPRALRGVADRVHVSRVVERSLWIDPLANDAGLNPLVGRTREMAGLLDVWQRARDGNGLTVLVEGEPGIGKSRLVHDLREALAHDAPTWLECRGSAFHENSAFRPVIELLEDTLGFDPDEGSGERAMRLAADLRRRELTAPDALPLLSALLCVAPGDASRQVDLSPGARRERTLELLVEWFVACSRENALVLAIEDLHWMDPSTRELLGLLISRAPRHRLLVVATTRPEGEPQWSADPDVGVLRLAPLALADAAALIARIAGNKPLPVELVEHIASRTDGVPLFVEELTRAILESGMVVEGDDVYEMSESAPELKIPSTLEGSLMARLDRLGPAKGVAQLAAVLGREFSRELLGEVAEIDADTLDRGLARLAEADLLHRQGEAPHATYAFRHALIQETAYRSLLVRSRRALHGRIAKVLEQRFPTLVATRPEEIARHCAEAGDVPAAVRYYARAGERAGGRSAHEEAIGHYRRGLTLLEPAPEGAQRARLELSLQMAIGVPLLAARGQGNDEVEIAYGRARELCSQVGDAPQLFRALWGLSAYHRVRGELTTATELGRELLDRAERSGGATERMLAHQAMGSALYYRGDWPETVRHLTMAIELHDPRQHNPLFYAFGTDPAIQCRAFRAMAFWVLGRSDEALRTIDLALERSRTTPHHFSTALALCWKTLIHQMRREIELARPAAEETIELCARQRYPLYLGLARVVRGWTLACDGIGVEAIEEIRDGMAQVASTGVGSGGAYLYAVLADALRRLGRQDEAIAMLDLALEISETKGQQFWDPELLRVKGEILDEGDEAETLMHNALHVARTQSARSLELRAAISLARRYERQGRNRDAHDLLAPVYDRFTEGLDTLDLVEARELLDRL
ncbi:MAG: AAA family ATPase [bacterium]|nr:AAA family ATPase [bacterium]